MSNHALIQAAVGLHATGGADITPDDSGTHNFNAIVVGSSGLVKFDFVNGSTLTIHCNKGIIYLFKVTRVYATGTVATDITGLNPRS